MTSICLTNKSMLLIGDRLRPDTRLKLCSILYFLCIPHLLNKSRATSQFVRVQLYSFSTGTLVSLSYTILHSHLGILSVHKSRVTTPAYYTFKKSQPSDQKPPSKKKKRRSCIQSTIICYLFMSDSWHVLFQSKCDLKHSHGLWNFIPVCQQITCQNPFRLTVSVNRP